MSSDRLPMQNLTKKLNIRSRIFSAPPPTKIYDDMICITVGIFRTSFSAFLKILLIMQLVNYCESFTSFKKNINQRKGIPCGISSPVFCLSCDMKNIIDYKTKYFISKSKSK